MNFRLTLILTVILVLIVTIVVVVQNRAPETKTPTEEHLLLGKEPKALKTLSLSRDNKTVLEFQKVNDKWALTQPIKAAIETYQVDSIVGALGILNYRDKFSPEPTGDKSLDATGVQPPRSIVKFTDDAGTEHVLNIGKRTPVGTRYVMLDKDPNIYEVDSSWFDKLDKDPADFRTKNILQIPTERIASITLQRPDQTIEMDRNDGKWTIVKPITTRANGMTIDDMASAVNNLQVESFTDVTLENAGLVPPLFTVTVQAREKIDAATQASTQASTQPATQPKNTPTTIQFGNYADLARKNVYAMISGSTEVVSVSADVFKKFDKPLFNVRDAAITPAAVEDATSIQISSAVSSADSTVPAKIILDKKAGAWAVQSPALPADSAAVSAFLTVIKNLRANKFVDSPGDLRSIGLDPPLKTITLTLPGQTQQETILIGLPQTTDPLTPVKRQGEPTVFLVQTPELAALSPSLLTLRDKAVAKISAGTITSISIKNPLIAPSINLEHVGANWTVNKKMADNSKVTALLADLDPITAQQWTAMVPRTGGTPNLQVDIVTEETVASSTTAPASQPVGPQPQHEVHYTLTLYGPTAKSAASAPAAAPGAVAWTATITPASNGAAWTFQPSAMLIDHLTNTAYEAPTTAPATGPATKP